jgi:hypothetical protein
MRSTPSQRRTSSLSCSRRWRDKIADAVYVTPTDLLSATRYLGAERAQPVRPQRIQAHAYDWLADPRPELDRFEVDYPSTLAREGTNFEALHGARCGGFTEEPRPRPAGFLERDRLLRAAIFFAGLIC